MILIVDRIGVHSGMHYYDSSFLKELKTIDSEVEIISNYRVKEEGQLLIYNFYKGLFLKRCTLLILSFIRLFCYLSIKKKYHLILTFYGDWLDVLFLLVCRIATKKIILDVHEVIALDKQSNKVLYKTIKFFVNRLSSSVISHSKRTNDLLLTLKYNKKIFYVPHFKYDFSDIESKLVGYDIQKIFIKSRINILFFGQIRQSKGVDVLYNALNEIDPSILSKIHIVIAGRDKEGLLNEIVLNTNVSTSIIDRYILDNEMYYLYNNTDYVILPYNEVSQSGILEAAIYFRKQLILSNLNNFKSVLNLYPSFGYIFESQNSEKLKALILELIKLPLREYSQKDIDLYYSRNEIDLFLNQLKEYLVNL
jgi:Glycosyltransferase